MSQPSVRIGASIQRLAKPSAYRPKGGKPTVCSLAENFGQHPYAVGELTLASPSRIHHVERRAPPPLAFLIQNVPAVGEQPLAMRRGFLFVGTAGKAVKKDRGGCNG